MSPRSPSATSASRPNSKRLLGLGLALLALAVLATVLATRDGRGEDQPTVEQRSDGPNRRPPATKTSSTGVFGAGGARLLPIPQGGLAPLVGESAQGAGMTVQTATSKQGFWVGTSESQRVYVAYRGGSAGGFRAQQLDRVDVRGTVREAPDDPAGRFGLSRADAAQLTELGGYVSAAVVSRSR